MKANLLIIEDEFQIRENLAELLFMEGFAVETAANGREGVDRAMQFQPDLILCDVMMPELNGYEVLEAVRTDRKLCSVPFIFLSAKAEVTDLRKGMSLGADDYLAKPVTSSDLLQAIESRLQRESIREAELQDQLDNYRLNLGRVAVHEYNTPLTGLMGFIDVMKQGLGTFDKAEKESMLDLMMGCCLRLKRTLDNERLTNHLIQRNSRSSANELLTAGTSIIFNRLVDQVRQTIGQLHEQQGNIVIDTQMSHLQISTRSLTKILEELIDNAVKFSVPDGEIRITGRKVGEGYRLTVINWGREFKARDITRIAPYTQFDRKYYEQQGSGLGLFIVKKLVELNNGQLLISSAPEGPTQVTVQLPTGYGAAPAQ